MKQISYEKLRADTDTLVGKITENLHGKRIYDDVFAVPRGGIYAGILVAEALGLELVPEEEIGPLTLVVDDLIDSGTTRKKFWEQDFAVLYRKPGSEVIPTYYAEDVEGWIEFPYEQTAQDVDDSAIRLLEFFGQPTNPENIERLKQIASAPITGD